MSISSRRTRLTTTASASASTWNTIKWSEGLGIGLTSSPTSSEHKKQKDDLATQLHCVQGEIREWAGVFSEVAMASETKPHRERFEVPHYGPFSHHLVSPWASWLNIKKSPLKSPENNLYPSVYSLPQKSYYAGPSTHLQGAKKNKRYKKKTFWVWTFYPALRWPKHTNFEMVERKAESLINFSVVSCDHISWWCSRKTFWGKKKKEGKNSQQGSRDRNEHPAGADVTNLGGETVPLWCHMGPILQIFVLEPVLLKVEQVLPSLAFLRRSVTNKCDV